MRWGLAILLLCRLGWSYSCTEGYGELSPQPGVRVVRRGLASERFTPVKKETPLPFTELDSIREQVAKPFWKAFGAIQRSTVAGEVVAMGKADQKIREMLTGADAAPIRQALGHYIGEDIPVSGVRHNMVFEAHNILTTEVEMAKLLEFKQLFADVSQFKGGDLDAYLAQKKVPAALAAEFKQYLQHESLKEEPSDSAKAKKMFFFLYESMSDGDRASVEALFKSPYLPPSVRRDIENYVRTIDAQDGRVPKALFSNYLTYVQRMVAERREALQYQKN